MNPYLIESAKSVLSGRRVLLGVSGSIAAYKVPELVRALRTAGAEVQVLLTEGGGKFVAPLTLETLSGRRVRTSLWDSETAGTHHIESARWGELLCVAPASANTIAKLANGLADDLLATEALAFTGPMLLAPAMNPAMWANPATQDNIERLRSRGVTLVGPANGEMACGETGAGRMVEPEALLQAVAGVYQREKRNGKRALVTLGPTRSAIDPVRFLSNRSSGKMGVALVWELERAGFETVAIVGPGVDEVFPLGTEVVRVQTADEMAREAQSRALGADLILGAAAVLDFEIREASAQKLKRAGREEMSLPLVGSIDVLAELGRAKRDGQRILGFAAETQDWVANARAKLLAKNCDLVFVNDISARDRGFEAATNAGWIVSSDGTREEVSLRSKPEVASLLVSRLATL